MKNLSFEEAIKRLEEIKIQLSSDDIELEKLIDLYEEGKKLTAYAQNKLDESVKKIEEINIEEE